jgi:hypothetical protein
MTMRWLTLSAAALAIVGGAASFAIGGSGGGPMRSLIGMVGSPRLIAQHTSGFTAVKVGPYVESILAAA